jgi:hypothetical protein
MVIAHAKVMVIDRKVVLTGSMNFTASAAQNSENVALISSERSPPHIGPLARSPRRLGAVHSARGLVSQTRGGGVQVRSNAEMKPERDDRLQGACDLGNASDIPSTSYSDRRSSGRSRTRCWKQSAVYGGEGLIESAVALRS